MTKTSSFAPDSRQSTLLVGRIDDELIRPAGIVEGGLDELVVVGGEDEERRFDAGEEAVERPRLDPPVEDLVEALLQVLARAVHLLAVGGDHGEVVGRAVVGRIGEVDGEPSRQRPAERQRRPVLDGHDGSAGAEERDQAPARQVPADRTERDLDPRCLAAGRRSGLIVRHGRI
ncbi:MAG TPA: hypothetical protein PKA74_14825 [Bauldia sp.]|nr:hypothetical protein [Bauldia sp.]